jgi:hypothetical protein
VTAATLARAQEHLRAIGGAPRPAGSDADIAARRYAARVLAASGFTTREEPFQYSAFPGRYGTPLIGAAGVGVVASAGHLAARGGAAFALVILVAGAVVLAVLGRWLARAGVLDLPMLRAEGVNLVAMRGGSAPAVWLVAHTDSKSQPVPQALRAAGITGLALTWVAAIALAIAQFAGVPGVAPFAVWAGLAVVAVVTGLPVMLSVVGTDSDGALDNASGVAAVLIAAEQLPLDLPIGVLLTTAEELGLAGARAWARSTGAAPNGQAAARRSAPATGQVALNCDGVDDVGMLTGMHSGAGHDRVLDALSAAAAARGLPYRSMRLVPGILTDSVALADAGWATVTLSRGTLATLRRVHTRRDSLDRLAGTGIPDAAAILADTARRLATQEAR